MSVFSNPFRVNLPALIEKIVSDDLSYRSYSVHNILTTPLSSLSSLSSYINENEKTLIIYQTNLQDGVYLRSGSDYILQILPDTSVNWVFVDIKNFQKKTAVYVSDTKKYTSAKLKKILLENNFSTTTIDTGPVNIFDIPVHLSSPSKILLIVNGFLVGDKSKMYYGEFRRIFYNDNRIVVDGGDMGSVIFNKDKNSIPNPNISFSTGENASVSLTIGNGSDSISWYCKAELFL